MLLRLDPPIPLRTPKGEGLAHFLDDLGVENEALWVVFLASGEIWWVPNSEVRATSNWSVGRQEAEKIPGVYTCPVCKSYDFAIVCNRDDCPHKDKSKGVSNV